MSTTKREGQKEDKREVALTVLLKGNCVLTYSEIEFLPEAGTHLLNEPLTLRFQQRTQSCALGDCYVSA